MAAPVTLHAVIKNVPTVTLKVYRINTTAYYTTHNKEVDAKIELDGLIPHETLTFDLSAAASLTRVEKTFTLDSLRGQRGVFVIELEGNGQATRAVVRKGLLTFLEHSTAVGHAFAVFNEAREQVKDARITMGSRTFTPDASSGFIIVPYNDTRVNDRSIVITSDSAAKLSSSSSASASASASSSTLAGASVGESFSCLGKFTHMSEQYSLEGGFVLSREALRSRAVAEVVVRPIFRRNGHALPTGTTLNTKDVRLTVNATDADGVNTTQVVEGFALPGSDCEATHAFSVPAGLASLTFRLDVTVVSARGTESVLSLNSDAVTVNTIERNEFSIRQLFLRRDTASTAHVVNADNAAGEGLVAVLVGKGGEPLSLQEITITARHRFIEDQVTRTLRTDAEGRVYIGSLGDICSVTATCAVSGCYATYSVSNELAANVVREIRAEVGAAVRVPYLGAETALTPAAFSLLRLGKASPGVYTQCELRCASLDTVTGHIVLNNLTEGEYELSYVDTAAGDNGGDAIIRHNIRVFPANQRVMGSYVLADNAFHQLQRDLATDLTVGAITGSAVATGNTTAGAVAAADSTVVIQVGALSKDTRVHVFSSHFLPSESEVAALVPNQPDNARSLPLPSVEHDYLTQRQLSGEQQYVLDRKRAAKRVGNMLTRPTLLLAKRFKQATQMDKDTTMRKAGETSVMSKKKATVSSVSASNSAFESDSRRERSSRGGYGGGSRRNRYSTDSDKGDRAYHSLEFLKESSTRLFNLKPDAEGRVTVARSALGAHHTTLTVIAVDGVAAFTKSATLLPLAAAAATASVSAGCVDVRMPAALNLNKHYTQQHLVTPLPAAGATLPISDVRSARIEVFSSLGELWELFQTLDVNRNEALLAKFSWLPRWGSLSRAEKEDKFNEFVSHELNFFIYCKDAAFFNDVVKPHIRHRHRKTVVDLYLLGGGARASLTARYATAASFQSLNAFERVLVAHAAGPAALQAVAGVLSDGAPVRDLEVYTQTFMSAMQSRALALGQSTTEQLQAEAKKRARKNKKDKDGDADGAEGGADDNGSDGGSGDDDDLDMDRCDESESEVSALYDECEKECEEEADYSRSKSKKMSAPSAFAPSKPSSMAGFGGAGSGFGRAPPPPPPCPAPGGAMLMRCAVRLLTANHV